MNYHNITFSQRTFPKIFFVMPAIPHGTHRLTNRPTDHSKTSSTTTTATRNNEAPRCPTTFSFQPPKSNHPPAINRPIPHPDHLPAAHIFNPSSSRIDYGTLPIPTKTINHQNTGETGNRPVRQSYITPHEHTRATCDLCRTKVNSQSFSRCQCQCWCKRGV